MFKKLAFQLILRMRTLFIMPMSYDHLQNKHSNSNFGNWNIGYVYLKCTQLFVWLLNSTPIYHVISLEVPTWRLNFVSLGSSLQILSQRGIFSLPNLHTGVGFHMQMIDNKIYMLAIVGWITLDIESAMKVPHSLKCILWQQKVIYKPYHIVLKYMCMLNP